jgi:hypothetical protein
MVSHEPAVNASAGHIRQLWRIQPLLLCSPMMFARQQPSSFHGTAAINHAPGNSIH